MTLSDLLALARLSLVRPIDGGQAIMRLDLDLMARLSVLLAAVLLGVVVALVLPAALGAMEAFPSPFTVVAVQLGVNLAAIGLMTGVGRAMGGTGRFADAVLLMGAFQGLMLLMQVVQLVVALVLPALAFPVATLTVGLFFWILTGFICAMHGFKSQILVLLGVFATLIAASFVVATVALMMGIEVPGVANV